MKKTIVEILKKERKEAHDDLLIWANDDEIQSLANKIEKQLLLHNVSVSFLYEFVNDFTDIEIPKEAIKESLDKLNER